MGDKTAKQGWWASRDAEFYTEGPFDTRDEAIRVGQESFDGDSFYIVEAGTQSIKFDAGRLLDDQFFENDDLASICEHGELDRIGDTKEADAELQQLLDVWLDKHAATFSTPTKFAWSRHEEFFPAGSVNAEEAA